MDTRTGRLISREEFARMSPEARQYVKPVKIAASAKQQLTKKISRNDPCPCGSGKKFKNCCQAESFKKHLALVNLEREQREARIERFRRETGGCGEQGKEPEYVTNTDQQP